MSEHGINGVTCQLTKQHFINYNEQILVLIDRGRERAMTVFHLTCPPKSLKNNRDLLSEVKPLRK